LWSATSERQICRLREILFRSILNKEIAYFDMNKTGELSTRLMEGINKVHDGISKKIAFLFQYVATLIASIILA
jgi:ABC-type multidrug transport system fused ATPase/permease subunit